jgi:hypothetical protein
MEGPLDGCTLPYCCPNCEAPLARTVASLHIQPRFTCSLCGVTASAVLDFAQLNIAARSISDARHRGEDIRA